ncbi:MULTISPECIES: hypothetical protein [unclassified Cyanobium]|uniref:hypothetical protein n=1 Tax=unclassified Cyanobium TaxID=2627006 RepID=UPI0020CBADCE|nr:MULTISPECIES: hypothetical protein [unclassified Cyanobium]MCP9857619.1 hypothetical protein [Cyanobium sp. Cruz-8H5]MCP9864808.1 hypothetical protein [Cyanobium sp. Cruz-8D1]
MSKRVLVTFTDSRMKAARLRICRQAEEMGVYTDIFGASEQDLNPDFRRRFKDYLRPEHRGFGYYAWKPQIVLQTLERLQDGDQVHWIDSGCHLNPAGRLRLQELFAMNVEAPSGIQGFECLPPNGSLVYEGRQFPDQGEYKWTKGDLLDRLGVREKPEITGTQQLGATTFFLRKCPATMDFMRHWIRVFSEDFSMIDDSPSRAPNLDGFVEHRHDQSIFSILAKLLPISKSTVFEFWFPRADDCWQPDWEMVGDAPIQIRRDRGIKRESRLKIAYLQAKGRVKRLLEGSL